MPTNTQRLRQGRVAAVLIAVGVVAAVCAAPASAAGGESTARVYLAGRDPAGLAAYAAAVAEPNSPDYHHYLAPAQFQTRFGASPDQVAAVTSWLTGAGLRVTATTAHYLAVTGTATEAQRAFGTGTPPSVAAAVLTVTRPNTADVTAGTDLVAQPINVGACSDYYGQKPATGLPSGYGRALSYDVCGYTPDQLRGAYGVAGSGLTGRGATVAIVDSAASPTIEQDVNTYSTRHGLPAMRTGQFSQNLPADIGTACPSQPSYGEESLDVEAVHAMAPDANIVYVGADCTNHGDDLLDAETRIVDQHLAGIVSDSWHLDETEAQIPPELVAAYQRIFQQGAVEGIGFYFAAGDSGDWSSSTADNQPAVQYPGSDPWVTSVGGTSLAIGPHGNYEWEVCWGDDLAPLPADGASWTDPPGAFVFGGGGGPSAEFGQPFYQRGVVPNALSHNGAARVVPDIAADADPATGMLAGLAEPLSPSGAPRYAEERVGGTSLATPLIAGIQADAQQAAHGESIGFADPVLYAQYGTPAYRDVTDDPSGPTTPIAVADQERDPSTGIITTGLGTLAHDTSLSAAPGYDATTGVGTPTRFYLYLNGRNPTGPEQF